MRHSRQVGRDTGTRGALDSGGARGGFESSFGTERISLTVYWTRDADKYWTD